MYPYILGKVPQYLEILKHWCFPDGVTIYNENFQKINVLLQAILLEKQIIIVSSNPNEIINICEAIFTLIYPLKWVCIYIPSLPLQCTETLSATTPFIIGISKILDFQRIQINFQL
ncbi:hypothetical protein IMG5_096990 [Ichthyophthirius multifiliis]|uniref:UDENN domain-containing protein n=1 Tax=Ichthyophthirius multifiliis TaxID=5932 RepID=G0QRR0_ICHMU|nr:hypothetical protein IMG5_096990 [Ichthyophthirius multifiliis]EGR32085.1 hypothetical protein IMG5_096990 [Ichthyophthirius multifiliis]|eukprot:XP_004035571.1 hypothetical protein IMG5_096990 [Ichthyophthirius multifiliis]